jgi:hypothetical protein
MNLFDSIHEFYGDKKFFDLKLKSGLDREEVFAHSIILASAVPGLGQVLIEHYNEKLDDDLTLIFPECSGYNLRHAVAEIYSALVQQSEVEQDAITRWSKALCSNILPVRVVESKPVRISKRTIKKRKIFEPDFDSTKRSRRNVTATKIKEEIPYKEEIYVSF